MHNDLTVLFWNLVLSGTCTRRPARSWARLAPQKLLNEVPPMSSNADPAPLTDATGGITPLPDSSCQALVNAMGVGFLAIDNAGTTVLANTIARDSFGVYPGVELLEAIPELWPKVLQKINGERQDTEFSLRREKSN